MKNSLRFFLCCIMLYLYMLTSLKGQIPVLSEDFAGFTTGTHTTPSTSDVSASLDVRMQTPGWTGSKIYSSGGEIKVGTEAISGWIETPAIDLSGNDGHYKIKFDICKWPADATSVQISLNGTVLGTLLTPSDLFETIQISGEAGTVNSKIRIQSVAKRFFLDNFSVASESITTSSGATQELTSEVNMYPVPVVSILHINNIQGINRIEIFDITGNIHRIIEVRPENGIQIDVESMQRGIYIIKFISGTITYSKTFIKL